MICWLECIDALSRYNEIVEADDSFELDFDSLGAGKTKPSKAAIRVNDLLEATTDNYRELSSFSYKLRFLLDIQISIFDLFYNRLREGLDAYSSRTSTITRTSKEDQTSLQGIEGLKRLCRIFGSADYLERAMRDWNDDVVGQVQAIHPRVLICGSSSWNFGLTCNTGLLQELAMVLSQDPWP